MDNKQISKATNNESCTNDNIFIKLNFPDLRFLKSTSKLLNEGKAV